MRVELLPLDPSFEAGVEIKVSEVPEDMGRIQRFQIAATHPARPGVVLRQPFTPPAGCNRSELVNTATWINYLPESWRMIVNALWASGPDAYAEVETFENAPVSIGEIKADKSRNARDWKPRDALVELLRRIDSGNYPDLDALVMAWRERSSAGEISSFYSASSPDIHVTLGILSRAEHMIHEIASGNMEPG
ncbi:hypothetical protein LESZY_00550 [Brevundimonas phage vB_BpoS-Leszy]|nr:hypothetical protein LESZY_00550 [Brevundimonas phage vB_BpoS-Leszy]